MIPLLQRECAVYPAANPGLEISSSSHLLPGPDTTDFSCSIAASWAGVWIWAYPSWVNQCGALSLPAVLL